MQSSPPANRLAPVRRSPRRGGRASGLSHASDPRIGPPTHRRPRPKSCVYFLGRNPSRLSPRRRDLHHRLRQNHPRCADGSSHHRYRLADLQRRTDAQQLPRRPTRRRRLHHLGGPKASVGRGNRPTKIHGLAGCLSPQRRSLQRHGNGPFDELLGRSHGHGPPRFRFDPSPLPRASPSGPRRRQTDRRNGSRRPPPLKNHVARIDAQCDPRQYRSRWLDQLPTPLDRNRSPRRDRTEHPRLGGSRLPNPSAGEPSTCRHPTGRGLPPQRRTPSGDEGTPPRWSDRWIASDMHRQAHRRPAPKRTRSRRSDYSLYR